MGLYVISTHELYVYIHVHSWCHLATQFGLEVSEYIVCSDASIGSSRCRTQCGVLFKLRVVSHGYRLRTKECNM